MSQSPFDHLLAVGETMACLVAAESDIGTESGWSVVTAGAESNVASCAAQLGLPSTWWSRIGGDGLGRHVLSLIRANGVDVAHVESVAGAPTGFMVKHREGSRTRVTYYRSGSAASTMEPADLHRVRRLSGRRSVLHTSGVTAALSNSCAELVEGLVLDRRTGAGLISFDVNLRPSLWAAGRASEVLRTLSDASDICFVGLDEAQELWGAVDAGDVRRLIPSPRVLVVKDGDVAATVFENDQVVIVPALPATVVEPVGAGDAFAGGFLAAYGVTGDVRFAARVGHVTAGAVLTIAGDVAAQPRLDALAHLRVLSDAEWIARAHRSQAVR